MTAWENFKAAATETVNLQHEIREVAATLDISDWRKSPRGYGEWQGASLRLLAEHNTGDELHRVAEEMTEHNCTVGDIFAIICHQNTQDRTLALLGQKFGKPYAELIKTRSQNPALHVALNCGWELEEVEAWGLDEEELTLAADLTDDNWEGTPEQLLGTIRHKPQDRTSGRGES